MDKIGKDAPISTTNKQSENAAVSDGIAKDDKSTSSKYGKKVSRSRKVGRYISNLIRKLWDNRTVNLARRFITKRKDKNLRQKETKDFFQFLGYSGKDLSALLNNLKQFSDDEYSAALLTVPTKKDAELGYTSKQKADEDYSWAMELLTSANLTQEQADKIIKDTKKNFLKDFTFMYKKQKFFDYFKSIIEKRVNMENTVNKLVKLGMNPDLARDELDMLYENTGNNDNKRLSLEDAMLQIIKKHDLKAD